LSELIELYGEAVVYKCAIEGMKHRMRSSLTNYLRIGYDDATIASKMSDWQPIQRARTLQTPQEKEAIKALAEGI